VKILVPLENFLFRPRQHLSANVKYLIWCVIVGNLSHAITGRSRRRKAAPRRRREKRRKNDSLPLWGDMAELLGRDKIGFGAKVATYVTYPTIFLHCPLLPSPLWRSIE